MGEMDKLRQSATEAFSKLAEQAGIDPSDYACGAEWVKQDSARLHIVQRYDSSGLPSLIVKYAMRPIDVDDFRQRLEAHQQAQAALKGNSLATVPRILVQDNEAQAYLMTFISGQTFLDLCREDDDHHTYLKLAGSWLGAYHAGTFQQERAFQPKFMLRHLAHLVGQMQRGERKVKGQRRFIELAGRMQEMSQDAEGHIGKISAKHGDLNAHNLLIEDGTVAAYDFSAQSYAPVGYDIARLLLSYQRSVGNIKQTPKGQVIPPDVKDSFFEGYDFISKNDPTIDFLMRVQILTDWNRMQDKTNLITLFRFERMRAIARRAFA